MNTDWQGIPTLTWDVGVVPMYPRFLDEKIFQTYYLQYPFQAIPTALHEITHFIYFKKWAELFPSDTKEMFEYPDLVWHLSELMAEAINSDERLRILIPDAEGYGHPIYRNVPFQKNKQDFSQYGYFAKKYLEFKKTGKSIDNFLKEAREEIKELELNIWSST